MSRRVDARDSALRARSFTRKTETRERAGGTNFFSAYSPMFTKRKLSSMTVVIVVSRPQTTPQRPSFIASTKAERENNKNKIGVADGAKEEGRVWGGIFEVHEERNLLALF